MQYHETFENYIENASLHQRAARVDLTAPAMLVMVLSGNKSYSV
jgi:hypothetical protein